MTKRMLAAILSLLLVVTMMPSLSVAAADSPSSGVAKAVTRADSLGLIPSSLKGNYTQNITRAEFSALLVPIYEKLTGTTITKLKDYTDTTDVNVRKMGGVNVASGFSDGTFKPDREITRQEAALSLSNLMSVLGKPLPASELTFADSDKIDTWAKDAVGKVQKAGIMSGTENNNFSPKGNAGKYTREQSIVSLLKVWDLMNNTQTGGNILIAYFSMPESDGVDAVAGASRVVADGKVLGNNQYIAGLIQQSAGGDLFEIKTTQKYPGSHDALVEFASDEQAKNARPELAAKIKNLDSYDVVFIVYPNWWGDLPMPLYSFLEQHDFSGKTIIPFTVHGGSGFADTIQTIRTLQPNAKVESKGYSVSRENASNAKSSVEKWLQSNGFTSK